MTDITRREFVKVGAVGAAALHVLWVGMLGGAAIGLAQRLAPGEDPDALAHDLLNSLLAGFTTNVGTTFVASECPFHSQDVVSAKSAHSHA